MTQAATPFRETNSRKKPVLKASFVIGLLLFFLGVAAFVYGFAKTPGTGFWESQGCPVFFGVLTLVLGLVMAALNRPTAKK